MQTFLPYPSFYDSAQCLDYKRLGKQRVEVKQILNALKTKKGWYNHPAVKMWENHEEALRIYGDYIIAEWINRGYKNNMPPFWLGSKHDGAWHIQLVDLTLVSLPSWFGNVAFHKSHQSNLVRKKPEYYRKYFPNVQDNLPYVWPTKGIE